jgi:hypothetical protein
LKQLAQNRIRWHWGNSLIEWVEIHLARVEA